MANIWRKQKTPDITICQSRLVIGLDNPWLTVSPDGLVYNPTENSHHRIVELKFHIPQETTPCMKLLSPRTAFAQTDE